MNRPLRLPANLVASAGLLLACVGLFPAVAGDAIAPPLLRQGTDEAVAIAPPETLPPKEGVRCSNSESFVDDPATGKVILTVDGEDPYAPPPQSLPEVIYPGHAVLEAQKKAGVSDLAVDLAQFEVAKACWLVYATPFRLAFLAKLAERGIARASLLVAVAYMDGKGIAANPETALRYLMQAVDRRDAAAMLILGEAYRDGRFGVQDPDKARNLISGAARQGFAMANEALPYLGIDPRTLGTTVPQIMALAQKGDGRALTLARSMEAERWPGIDYVLGVMSHSKSSNKDDVQHGLQLIQSAASAHIRDAFWQLGTANEDGAGTPKNKAEALLWYMLAHRTFDAGPSRDALKTKINATASVVSEAHREALEVILPYYSYRKTITGSTKKK